MSAAVLARVCGSCAVLARVCGSYPSGALADAAIGAASATLQGAGLAVCARGWTAVLRRVSPGEPAVACVRLPCELRRS